MARAVAPWTWAKKLRDHGPSDPGFLLAMLVLRTYMDESGFAYPGQGTWAKGARKSVRMIQRYIVRAQHDDWLVVGNAGRTGQGWKHNGYRCCVPDWVALGEKDEVLADAVTAIFGEVEDTDIVASAPVANATNTTSNAASTTTNTGTKADDILMSSRQPKGNDILVSLPSPSPTLSKPIRNQGDDIGVTKATTSAAEGDDTTGKNVATQLCPTKSALRSSPYKFAQEEGALSRTTVTETVSAKGVETKASKATSATNPTTEIVAEAPDPEGQRKRRDSVRKLLDKGFTVTDVFKIVQATGITIGDVKKIQTEWVQEHTA